MQAFFTDMLNNKVVGATFYSEGGIKGLGGEAFYLNQKKRLNWGLGASHVPYILGIGLGISDTAIGSGGRRGTVYDQQLVRLQRRFDEDEAGRAPAALAGADEAVLFGRMQ